MLTLIDTVIRHAHGGNWQTLGRQRTHPKSPTHEAQGKQHKIKRCACVFMHKRPFFYFTRAPRSSTRVPIAKICGSRRRVQWPSAAIRNWRRRRQAAWRNCLCKGLCARIATGFSFSLILRNTAKFAHFVNRVLAMKFWEGACKGAPQAIIAPHRQCTRGVSATPPSTAWTNKWQAPNLAPYRRPSATCKLCGADSVGACESKGF
jgi:hypothetical protein